MTSFEKVANELMILLFTAVVFHCVADVMEGRRAKEKW